MYHNGHCDTLSSCRSQKVWKMSILSITNILLIYICQCDWWNVFSSECPHAIDNDSEDEDVIILWNYVSLTDKVNICPVRLKQTNKLDREEQKHDILTPNIRANNILKIEKNQIDNNFIKGEPWREL